jgi:hypothetical protein
MNNTFEHFEDIQKISGEKQLLKNVVGMIPDLLSPGNMDKEILRSTFSILGLFLTSNQLVTVHTHKDNKV